MVTMDAARRIFENPINKNSKRVIASIKSPKYLIGNLRISR
jgi:hypothetical protein